MWKWIGLFSISILFSCSLSRSIRNGSSAYDQKQYSVAVELLEDEIQQITDKSEYASVSFMIGDAYKYLNDSDNSLKWFIEAAKNGYGPKAYWEMAYSLKKKERYEDAILSFRKLEQMTSRTNEIRLEIEKCRQARKWTNTTGEHDYILEAVILNSVESDYAPVIYNNKYLIFTSDRPSKETDEIYKWTGSAYSDLYISEISHYSATPFSDVVNTPHNEGTATFNKEGSVMFFTRCFSEVGDSYCRILKSTLESGEWTYGEAVFRMKPQVNYGDPMLIENDDVLIFTSDDPTGIGGHDLYYSVQENDGSWSDPELMPPYLNTIGEERFPTWKDGSLYYSSDHLAGLGGLDIFKTNLNDDGSWTTPVNLMAPINSSEDDYSYVIVPDVNYPEDVKLEAFFTSTRGIFGNDDIYSLVELKNIDELEEQDTLVEVVTEEEVLPKTLFLRVHVTEKLFAVSDNPNSYVVGKRDVPNASIKLTLGSISRLLNTDENGEIIIELDTTLNYEFLVGKQGYLNRGDRFPVSEMNLNSFADGHVFVLDLEIEKIYEGVEITLENIYYDFNEWFIRDDAKPALQELIKILDENPAIKIELSSHTDCRGEDDYNIDLSQKRADAAIAYIKDSGNIDADRLGAVGYGESRPEIACICDECSEDEHQINRRTTFKIVR